MTRDNLIFPFVIMQILRHFSVSFFESPHFTVTCDINVAIVRWSEAQLRLRRPRTETMTPSTSTAPSTFAPSSSAGEVTFVAIMAQFVRMDARFDILNDELC